MTFSLGERIVCPPGYFLRPLVFADVDQAAFETDHPIAIQYGMG